MGLKGLDDKEPALNMAAKFMSGYKSKEQTEGLVQDLCWITAAVRRSTPFKMSDFTTGVLRVKGPKGSVSKYCYRTFS